MICDANYIRMTNTTSQSLNYSIAESELNLNCSNYDKNEGCNYRGNCKSDGDCVCDDGYATSDDSQTQCDYKMKSRLIAFLLQLFLGAFSGAGEWYLGNVDYAIGQLLLCIGGFCFIICFMPILFACFSIEKKETESKTVDFTVDTTDENECCNNIILIIYTLFATLIPVGITIWWIYDLVMIANGTRTDHNGMETSDDM